MAFLFITRFENFFLAIEQNKLLKNRKKLNAK